MCYRCAAERAAEAEAARAPSTEVQAERCETLRRRDVAVLGSFDFGFQ